MMTPPPEPIFMFLPQEDLHWVPRLFLALSFVLILFYYYKQQERKIKPEVSAHQEACSALERLVGGDFYTQLDLVMRRYVAREYEVAALESTTQELIVALYGVSIIDERLKYQFECFFKDLERLKFASMGACSKDDQEKWRHRALELIARR